LAEKPLMGVATSPLAPIHRQFIVALLPVPTAIGNAE